ncbi:unnamed protein product [Arabidopsis thaliana]|uniref:Uncharacterized protein n=1 Tax=Arabidopsis thaliana TaxID=3702 RepID=A0A654GAF1_ARATH|nr:unnamed protein product [Arabidopsis thaliana]
MDQTEEPPLNTHQQHPEEVEHHENGATKMFRKVKARAKKFKNSLTKHGQSNEHEQDHDLVEEDDDDDELEPEVIDAPGVTGKPRETNVPASEEIIPPGTKVFPVVSSDYTKPTESVPLQEASYGHDAPAHSVRTTFTSDKEEKRDVPIHHPLSELPDREESRETHHESLNTPVSLLSGTEDVTSTFAPSGDDEYLDGQRKVNVETPITLEEESAVSDYLSGVSNYQSKVTDPTKEETGGVPEIAESFGNMEVTDESPDQKPGQFERDLSTRSKEFKEFDQDFDSVLGKDSPAKFPGESGVVFPVGFGDESGAELEKDFPTRSHDFDMKTETGMDTNSPSRSHEFDLKTESGNDKNSPMGFGSESGAELEKEFDQKNDSGRNEYSPESDGGLGAPLGGNFPVRSHELDLKNESDIDKDVPTGFDGEPDFLAKGRPGYGEASEEDKFPARSDDVEVETELGRDLKTETLDQFSPELSRPKERDEFKESRDDFEETRDEKTEEPKQSTYTEKFASMLGYSGEIPVGDQTQVAGTVDEKLTPVNEKDQETESAVTTKLPISGGGSGVEEQQGEDKSVSGRDYVAEKLTTEEEDKAFSDMVAEKLQIGGEEEKKETTTKEVEKISTEKAASEEGEAVEEEVKGGGGMVGRIKGWFGGGATDEVKPESPHSVEEAPKSSGWFGGGATEEVKPKSPHSVEESPQSLGSTVVPVQKEL